MAQMSIGAPMARKCPTQPTQLEISSEGFLGRGRLTRRTLGAGSGEVAGYVDTMWCGGIWGRWQRAAAEKGDKSQKKEEKKISRKARP